MAEERRVLKGEEFSVEMTANPTTGHLWSAEFDADKVRLVRHEYALGNPAPGSGGTDRFVFVAGKDGESVISFKLRRPWEPQAIDSRDVRVVAG